VRSERDLAPHPVAAEPETPVGVSSSGPTADEIKGQARVLAEATPPRLRLGYAQAFCAAVLERYWTKLRPSCPQALRRAPKTFDSRTVRPEGLTVAEALADAASARAADEASYLVGSTYAAMLPDDYRSVHGVFYTPPAVVDRLLDSAEAAGVDWNTCRALDPACGGGAFLGPLARRMIAPLKRSDRRIVLRNLAARLVGYEIDPFAAWISAVFLDASLNEELGFVGDEAFQLIMVCDSLSRSEEANFDLVIGNPPYGRLKLKPELRSVYQRSLFGHANLYGVFLDLALRKTRPDGGVVAYVTPTGFLSGEYFKNLRGLLAREASPVTVEFISERRGVFDDVLQETLLAVFRRGASTSPVQLTFVEVSDAGPLAVTSAGEASLPASAEQPWIVPRRPDAAALAERLRSMSSRLADWGYGVSTGPLVWNRFKPQLRHKPGKNVVPLIWAEAVGADGTFALRADRRNHAPYFAVETGDEWLIVRRPCVLLQRTTAKEQPRRLIAAELPRSFLDANGGVVTVENHLNMIVTIVETPPVDTARLAAFLNSAAADSAFRCMSGTVAVSAYELESMPLPAPWAVRNMPDGSHSASEIEAFCARLYGPHEPSPDPNGVKTGTRATGPRSITPSCRLRSPRSAAACAGEAGASRRGPPPTGWRTRCAARGR
jgi:adenine-specific DNA-methyltransferase